MPVLRCMSSFEGNSYKNFQDRATSSFISCSVKLADIIFYIFIELHSTLSGKRFLPPIFLFKWFHPVLPLMLSYVYMWYQIRVLA